MGISLWSVLWSKNFWYVVAASQYNYKKGEWFKYMGPTCMEMYCICFYSHGYSMFYLEEKGKKCEIFSSQKEN